MELFFLFVPFLKGFNIHRNTIGFGGISTYNNPFWSQKLPGFHKCQDESLPYIPSSSERKIVLNFESCDNNRNVTIIHCEEMVSKKTMKKYHILESKEAFITFYLNKKSYRANINEINNGQMQIFTHYHIQIMENSNTKPDFAVFSENPVLLKDGIVINISFSLGLVTRNETTAIISTGFRFKALIYAFLICFLIYLAYFYSIYKSGPKIPIVEVWRIPKFYSNTSLFGLFGIQMLVASLIVFCYINDESNLEKLLFNSITLSSLIASLIRSYISTYLSIQVNDADFISSTLLIYLCGFLPLHFSNLFCSFFQSFRGKGIWSTVSGDCFFLISTLLAARSLGRSACTLLFRPSYEATFGQSAMVPDSRKSSNILISIIVTVLSGYVLHPCILHVYTVVFDNSDIDFSLIGNSIILFSLIHGLFGIHKTYRKLFVFSGSWMEDHISTAFLCSVSSIISSMFFFVSRVRSFDSILFFLSYLIGIVSVVFGIAVSSSFIPSFFITSFVFYPKKQPE